MGWGSKKGFALVLIILLAGVAMAAAENETTPRRRTFTGSAEINIGSYDDYFLRVVASSQFVYALPGETIEFKLYVRRGDDPVVLHEVQLLDVPDEFALGFSPEVIAQVRNIDMVPVTTTLTVPPGTPEGDYPVLIKVKGKEFVEDGYPLDLKVRVGSHTDWGSVLFLALAAGLVALLVWRIINIKRIGAAKGDRK